ncbi:integrase arm-type DNA-binding domain-containing protein [Shewanella algae]|uniref:integrase arm-type DNA-binding domain-containing protein n=1 Tax=Shewanella algae TaxID=38313 RepID=UPI00300797E7
MARSTNKLTAKAVENAKEQDKPYRVSDCGNLYLYVRRGGVKSWDFRYLRPSTGKPTYWGSALTPLMTILYDHTVAILDAVIL